MATIDKINKDIAAAKAKIAELQKKIRTLEAQKIEEENLQIVKLVKTVNLDQKTLTVFLKAYAKGDIVLPDNYKAELEKKKVADEVKKEMISLAAVMAGRIAAASMDEEKQNALIEETLSEIGEGTWLN